MCISGVKATFKMTKFRRKGAACGGLGWTILISALVPLSFAQTQVPPGALPTSTSSDASTSSRPIGPMAFFINTSAYVVVQDDLLKPNYQEQHFGFRWGGNMIMHARIDPVFQQWIITLCSMQPSIAECKSEAGSSWQERSCCGSFSLLFFFRSNLLAEAAAFKLFISQPCVQSSSFRNNCACAVIRSRIIIMCVKISFAFSNYLILQKQS